MALEYTMDPEIPWAVLSRDPDFTVETGLAPGEYDNILQIYYHENTTFVVPIGAWSASDAWSHPGKVLPEIVLVDYLAEPVV